MVTRSSIGVALFFLSIVLVPVSWVLTDYVFVGVNAFPILYVVGPVLLSISLAFLVWNGGSSRIIATVLALLMLTPWWVLPLSGTFIKSSCQASVAVGAFDPYRMLACELKYVLIAVGITVIAYVCAVVFGLTVIVRKRMWKSRPAV